jgi:hypothetical protein
VVSAVINQSNSPCAVAQVGTGTFSQSAFTQQQRQLIQVIDHALNSQEFSALSSEQQQGFRDIAEVVKSRSVIRKARHRKASTMGQNASYVLPLM